MCVCVVAVLWLHRPGEPAQMRCRTARAHAHTPRPGPEWRVLSSTPTSIQYHGQRLAPERSTTASAGQVSRVEMYCSPSRNDGSYLHHGPANYPLTPELEPRLGGHTRNPRESSTAVKGTNPSVCSTGLASLRRGGPHATNPGPERT